MPVVDIAIIRLNKEAELFCSRFNANHSTDAGKCLFQSIDEGVELYHAHYLLDSQHSDYQHPFARIVVKQKEGWGLYVPKTRADGTVWLPYPSLPTSHNLEAIFKEIVNDPQGSFWAEPAS